MLLGYRLHGSVIPVLSIVVLVLGYLIRFYIFRCLNQKGTTMETTRLKFGVLRVVVAGFDLLVLIVSGLDCRLRARI